MNKKINCIGASLISMAMAASAENVTIYRWIDENNIVHFSQYQPQHEEFTEMNFANRDPVESPLPAVAPSSTLTKIINDYDESPSTEELFESEMSDKCQEAQTNVTTLENFDNIKTTDNEGKTSILSQQQKKQQLEMNLKRVDIYCSR